MNIFPFVLDKYNNAILVEAIFDFSTLVFLVDTGASNTIIDLSSVIIESYESHEFIDKVEVETANGVINADII